MIELLIGGRLSDQPVLAIEEAIVGGIDDEGVVELASLLQRIDHRLDEIVDRLQGLKLGAIVLRQSRLRDAVDGRSFLTNRKLHVLQGSRVLRRGNRTLALHMHRLRREIEEEGLRLVPLLGDEAHGASFKTSVE